MTTRERLRHHPYRSVPFSVGVIASIFIAVALPDEGLFKLVLSLAAITMLGAGGQLIAKSSRWLVGFAVALALSYITGVADYRSESSTIAAISHGTVVLLLFLCLYTALRHAIFTEETSPMDRVIASITGYFVLCLIFARVFLVISDLNPEAFSDNSLNKPLDDQSSVYFSLISITTQGYGDIVPVSNLARISAAFEGAIGTTYLAVIVGTMVSSLNHIDRKK